MKKQAQSQILTIVRLVAIVALLAGVAMGTRSANALSIALDKGYVDLVYGPNIDDQPTGMSAESKLWYADGLWWGALFNGATKQHEIFRYNNQAHTWIATGFALDTRYDSSEDIQPPDPTADVDSRLDVLFNAATNKLYVASHVDVLKGTWTNNSTQWGNLSRYTYNPATKTYTLDADYPVTINQNRTESLAIAMESDATLWTTFVSTPQGDPESHVFVNWSNAGASGQDNWQEDALDLTDVVEIGEAANVSTDDISAVITYGTKTGVMWSNDRELTPLPTRTTVGKFYYAEHDNTQGNSIGWTLTDVTALFPDVTANDHIHLIADAAGNVYATIKTNNINTGNDMVGVLKRDTAGTWSWAQVTTAGGNDTNPTAVLNETTGNLHVFVVSNEGGGLICEFNAPAATLAYGGPQNCREDISNSRRFIYDATPYNRFNNPTSTKQNVTTAMGILVVASDDDNSKIYGHNLLGGATTSAPDIDQVTPASGGTTAGAQVIATARFTEAMDASTITNSTFTVVGPGGAVGGAVTYDPATMTATFTSTSGVVLPDGVYTATVDSTVEDSGGTPMLLDYVWSFTFDYNGNVPPTVVSTSPTSGGTASGSRVIATVTFSEAMNSASINNTTFLVSGPDGPVAGTVTYDPATMTARFVSNDVMGTGTYNLSITTGAQDALGTPMGAPYAWTITYTQTGFPVFLPYMEH